MNPRLLALGALAAFAVATGTASIAQTVPPPSPPPAPASAPSTTPTPTAIVVPGTTPTPTATNLSLPTPTPAPTPTINPRHRHDPKPYTKPSPGPTPSDTPEPQQFQTMDGVWEIEGQTYGERNAVYSHLNLIQKDQTLTGTWKKDDKHVFAVTGTFDGRVFKLTAIDAAAKTTYTLSGYVENYSDLVGQYTTDVPNAKATPFTGQHRKKEKLAA